MKGIAFILALIIFSTSVKGSSFTMAIIGASQGTMSCCKKSDDSSVKHCDESEEEDQEDSGCCEGDNCNCTCCLHIAYLQHFNHNSFGPNDFSEVKFDYSFLYHADYLSSVFHPPSAT